MPLTLVRNYETHPLRGAPPNRELDSRQDFNNGDMYYVTKQLERQKEINQALEAQIQALTARLTRHYPISEGPVGTHFLVGPELRIPPMPALSPMRRRVISTPSDKREKELVVILTPPPPPYHKAVSRSPLTWASLRPISETRSRVSRKLNFD